MKKPLFLLLSLVALTSCAKGPCTEVLPDPKIEMNGSTSALYVLGASVFADGTGCILRVEPEPGNIYEKEPLPAQERYDVKVAFKKKYELTGAIGYLDEDGAAMLRKSKMPHRWYPFEHDTLFGHYGVNVEVDISKGYFDLTGLEVPENASYILLGVTFYSPFYGNAQALFYAHLA